MTEEIEIIKQWKYDFAWKQLENAQIGNERLDNKAMSIINFSSIIIPILTGILIFGMDKSIAFGYSLILIIESLVFLIGSIFFAFMSIWLRNQGIIRTNDQFNAIGNDDIKKILGNTAKDIANWQELVVNTGIDKSRYVLISSISFIIALILTFLSAINFLFFY